MKRDLLKNTLIIGAGRIFAQFSSLLLIPLYTSFLSPDEYGVGDLIITYAALALPLVTLSLEQGAFRLLVDARDNEVEKKKIVSFLSQVVTATFIAATLIAIAVGSFYGSISLVCLALVYIAGSISMNICLWLARGLGDNAGYAKGSMLIGGMSLLLSLAMVAGLHLGLSGMIGALTLANLIGAAYYALRLRLYKYISFRKYNRRVAKELLSYSLPLVPNSMSWWLVNAADRTIIALMLGVAATGIFAVAVKFPAILIGLFSIFWVSWHESASLHIKSKDRDAFFSKVTNTSIVLFGTVGLLILATLSVVFPLVVGEEFSEAYIYVPILMLGALLHTVSTLYGSIYAAKMQTRRILNTTLLAGIVSIVGTFVLIHSIGLFAAALASVAGYIAMTVYRHYDIQKYVAIRIYWPKLLLFGLLGAISVAIYYINSDILNLANVLFVCVVAIILNKGIISSTKEMIWERLNLSR